MRALPPKLTGKAISKSKLIVTSREESERLARSEKKKKSKRSKTNKARSEWNEKKQS